MRATLGLKRLVHEMGEPRRTHNRHLARHDQYPIGLGAMNGGVDRAAEGFHPPRNRVGNGRISEE
jgi:hypothetical protein